MKTSDMSKEAELLEMRFKDFDATGGKRKDFAMQFGVPGGPSMIYQHLKMIRPIHLEAAIAYAKGFNVTLEEISPRLAEEALNWIAELQTIGVSPGSFKPNVQSRLKKKVTSTDTDFVKLEHLSPRPSMGNGTNLSEQIQVVQHLEVYEQWLQEAVGTTDPKRIKVLTAVGRSMLPTIGDKDLVFVDITKKSIDAPGIYVIDVNQRLLLKKVMIQGNGTLIIQSENTQEFPDVERYPADELNETVHICGKVMAWWSLKKG